MKEQLQLIKKLLKDFNDHNFIDEIILVGSWCLYFYSKHLLESQEFSLLRTKDIDFVIDKPERLSEKIDIKMILEKAGFEEFLGISGYSKFMNIDLDIEFLVNEKGRGSNKPIILDKINVNAMPLKYLSILQNHTTTINIDEFKLRLPEPAAFVLHKYIVSQRRDKKDKMNKDIHDAENLTNILLKENYHQNKFKEVYNNMPGGWQKTLNKILTKENIELYNYINS